MSFLGSRFTSQADNSFVNPEPKGVDASAWSNYPAEQDVDMAGFDLNNVNNLSVSGEIDLDDLVLQNLTIENDLTVEEDIVAKREIELGTTGSANGILRSADTMSLVFTGTGG